MFYFESNERMLYICFCLDCVPKLCVRQTDGALRARGRCGETVRFSPTARASLSVTFWTFPCSAWGVDTGTGARRIVGLVLKNNWCCISIWAHRTPILSQLLPCYGKVFISVQTNTRVRMLICGFARPHWPLRARFTRSVICRCCRCALMPLAAIVWKRCFGNLDTHCDVCTCSMLSWSLGGGSQSRCGSAPRWRQVNVSII